MLTRKQVESYWTSLVQDKVGGVQVAQLLDTDAALRAENERLKQDTVPRSRYNACNNDWLEAQAKVKSVQDAAAKEIADLTAQLAAMMKERRETWVKVAKSFDKKFFATDKRLDDTRDYRVDEFYAWCLAQAEEQP
jgi:hypothetical protein